MPERPAGAVGGDDAADSGDTRPSRSSSRARASSGGSAAAARAAADSAAADPAADAAAADTVIVRAAADTTATTASGRTRPSARNRPITTIPAGRRPFAVTLPSQPPVTDYRRLDFSPPEVLPGRTAHYPVRATATTRDLPAFVVVHEVSDRVATLPQRRDSAGVLAAERRRSRAWAGRLAWTVAGSTVAALVVAAVGFYGLARL